MSGGGAAQGPQCQARGTGARLTRDSRACAPKRALLSGEVVVLAVFCFPLGGGRPVGEGTPPCGDGGDGWHSGWEGSGRDGCAARGGIRERSLRPKSHVESCTSTGRVRVGGGKCGTGLLSLCVGVGPQPPGGGGYKHEGCVDATKSPLGPSQGNQEAGIEAVGGVQGGQEREGPVACADVHQE